MLSATGTGSGLVAGGTAHIMDKTIKVKVLRAFFWKGAAQKVGAVLDYPEGLAREAIHMGKAERVAAAPAPAPKVPDKAKDEAK